MCHIIEAPALDCLCGHPWEDPLETQRGIKAGSSVFSCVFRVGGIIVMMMRYSILNSEVCEDSGSVPGITIPDTLVIISLVGSVMKDMPLQYDSWSLGGQLSQQCL